ncbi:MAG TPA: class I poly(R)-hydroxyalkanoic acid synthase [Burkholderiaceae bacterium]|nr:class I poly(R)-hydroxyalkanoic acid synthase [Burkholderiaceae bacterium]
MEKLQRAGADAAASLRSPADGAAAASLPVWTIDPSRLLALQNDYTARLQRLWADFAAGGALPKLPDRRFADPAWTEQPQYAWAAALYLLNSEFMQQLASAVDADTKTKDRIKFMTQQWVDALAPSNFLATNPEAQRKLLDTQGESLRRGIGNFLSDLQKGRISQTDETAFEVGRNVANTPGAVIYQNELFQLIQYAPTTPKVAERPLLIVPPCINKFYILDLQPENSFVAHAVGRGNTVFMISWRNIGREQSQLTWDDYLQTGIFEALQVVREVSGSEKINALGFCVGGTILACALAALAARGEHPVQALTLMTTLLDFEHAGVLSVFIDEHHVAYREQTLEDGGVVLGKELARTFSSLRPNDLVWSYVVNSYLKGESPPPFDLLYWNSDSTNLPGPMYSWYLRHMYLQNELRLPGKLTCAGEKIDLRTIKAPTYIFGAREDHIVPWQAAYASTRLLSGELRFVLGASGHIAGAINPVSKNRRSYWVGESLPPQPEQWFAQAVERPGSWWTDWADWLERHHGKQREAPRRLGSAKHKPIEDAPGSYVKAPAPE